MKALHGKEAILYLESLKRGEIERAKKRPIGQRVGYYRAQVPWINEELKKEKAALQITE